MESPTKILSDEHKVILKVVDALLKECSAIEAGKAIDNEFFGKAIDFIRSYADKFHHAKEEDILFAELSKADMHCNPIPQMAYEHELGRGFVKGIEDGVREGNRDAVISNARQYSHLLQEHIFKEDNILYPMADEALSLDAQISVLDRFHGAEKGEVKQKYIRLADEFGERKNI